MSLKEFKTSYKFLPVWALLADVSHCLYICWNTSSAYITKDIRLFESNRKYFTKKTNHGHLNGFFCHHLWSNCTFCLTFFQPSSHTFVLQSCCPLNLFVYTWGLPLSYRHTVVFTGERGVCVLLISLAFCSDIYSTQ